MRAVVQRVTSAAVTIADEPIARIGPGLLVLLGVARDDDPSLAEVLASKVAGLRIFADEHKPMNRSVADVGGAVLIVSQFTLAADTRKGMRPGFSTAAPPEIAEPLYEAFIEAIETVLERPVGRGRFGADMQIALVNDGPVTFVLDAPASR
ncbi:MAG: D-aminoacyl-tRNA deacylase [Pseudomonadota bacterium]